MAQTDSKSAAAPATATASNRLFSLPTLYDNPNGWGPASVPQTPLTMQLSAVPFAPFNKNDRLGRVSDWTSRARGGFGGAFQSRGQPVLQAAVASAVPGGPTVKDDDESSFSTVDGRTKKGPKPLGQRPKFTPNKRFVTNGARGRGAYRGRGGRGGRGGGRGGFFGAWGNPADMVPKENSIEPQADWKQVGELELAALTKVNLGVGDAKDLTSAGVLEPYNTDFDAITPKAPKTLMRMENKQFFAVTTSEDPILARLMAAKTGNVYGTDAILSVLMASPKSVNSWDIVARKEGDTIVFDKRPDSKIDFLSVNENWNEVAVADKDHMNFPPNLAVEATCIAQNLSQQMLDKDLDTDEHWAMDEPFPFADRVSKKLEPASVGYRYRLFNLGDACKVVVRAEVNGFVTRKDEKQFLSIKTLNEFDSSLSGKVDWRQKLETQSSAVLTTEMKNNANRLMRYAAQLYLSGAEHLRLGFVSRIHPKDNYNHNILLAQRYPTPALFAQTLNIEVKQMWGTLRTIIQTLQKLENGKYVLLKDATKATISIYQVPATAFANIGSAAPSAPPATTAAAAASAGSAAAPAKVNA